MYNDDQGETPWLLLNFQGGCMSYDSGALRPVPGHRDQHLSRQLAEEAQRSRQSRTVAGRRVSKELQQPKQPSPAVSRLSSRAAEKKEEPPPLPPRRVAKKPKPSQPVRMPAPVMIKPSKIMMEAKIDEQIDDEFEMIASEEFMALGARERTEHISDLLTKIDMKEFKKLPMTVLECMKTKHIEEMDDRLFNALTREQFKKLQPQVRYAYVQRVLYSRDNPEEYKKRIINLFPEAFAHIGIDDLPTIPYHLLVTILKQVSNDKSHNKDKNNPLLFLKKDVLEEFETYIRDSDYYFKRAIDVITSHEGRKQFLELLDHDLGYKLLTPSHIQQLSLDLVQGIKKEDFQVMKPDTQVASLLYQFYNNRLTVPKLKAAGPQVQGKFLAEIAKEKKLTPGFFDYFMPALHPAIASKFFHKLDSKLIPRYTGAQIKELDPEMQLSYINTQWSHFLTNEFRNVLLNLKPDVQVRFLENLSANNQLDNKFFKDYLSSLHPEVATSFFHTLDKSFVPLFTSEQLNQFSVQDWQTLLDRYFPHVFQITGDQLKGLDSEKQYIIVGTMWPHLTHDKLMDIIPNLHPSLLDPEFIKDRTHREILAITAEQVNGMSPESERVYIHRVQHPTNVDAELKKILPKSI